MLIDDGVLAQADGHGSSPATCRASRSRPTILALLPARLDRLDARAARGHRARGRRAGARSGGAPSRRSRPRPRRPRVGAALQSLVRKELIRPDRSELRSEDAFRFAHILIRDAAYDGLPKAVRAQLHERWRTGSTARRTASPASSRRSSAYHLEQAHRALLELAPRDERAAALAERMAQRLGAAGERRFARGDMPAAVNLLSRVTDVLPGAPSPPPRAAARARVRPAGDRRLRAPRRGRRRAGGRGGGDGGRRPPGPRDDHRPLDPAVHVPGRLGARGRAGGAQRHRDLQRPRRRARDRPRLVAAGAGRHARLAVRRRPSRPGRAPSTTPSAPAAGARRSRA